MCLLDYVEAWDPQRILCRASSHAPPTIRYVRTANSVPPAVSNMRHRPWPCTVPCWQRPTAPAHGSVIWPACAARSCMCPRLDDIAADLEVEATCITRNENTILYQFSVSAEGRLLLEGRATVVLDADALTHTSGAAS